MKTPESVTIVLHIHALSSRSQHYWIFCLTNILQFWQTCSCWNNLVSPSRTALLWISHTLWTWPQMQSIISRTQVKRGGNKNSGCDDRIPSHANSRRKHFTFLNFQQVPLVQIILWLWQSCSCCSIEWVQLYHNYGLVNLLKVCALNLYSTHLIWDTKKLYIVYKVDLGWGLVCKAMD